MFFTCERRFAHAEVLNGLRRRIKVASLIESSRKVLGRSFQSNAGGLVLNDALAGEHVANGALCTAG